jgi:hypothetical protein
MMTRAAFDRVATAFEGSPADYSKYHWEVGDLAL